MGSNNVLSMWFRTLSSQQKTVVEILHVSVIHPSILSMTEKNPSEAYTHTHTHTHTHTYIRNSDLIPLSLLWFYIIEMGTKAHTDSHSVKKKLNTIPPQSRFPARTQYVTSVIRDLLIVTQHTKLLSLTQCSGPWSGIWCFSSAKICTHLTKIKQISYLRYSDEIV